MARPQFSLRGIFAVTSTIALMLGEAVVFPGWLAAVVGVAVTTLLAPAVAAGIVYSRGYLRAFCIGSLIWWLTVIWFGFSLGIPKPGGEIAQFHRSHQRSLALRHV